MEVTRKMEDAKIIELFFARNEEAIAQTDAAYGSRLLRLADNIVHSREDAEESVNDTYLKTWNSIPPRKPSHFFPYLARICRNLSLDRLDWANAAKRKAEVVSLTQEMEQCIPDIRRDAELDERELGRILNAFLETLSPENQMVFVRRYWYVDTTAEIAARYGIKESTLITRLHRIRTKLAEYLNKEGIAV